MNYIKKNILVILLIFNSLFVFSQSVDTIHPNSKEIKNYSFVVQDVPIRLFTMRQFDEIYLSSYRYFSNWLTKNASLGVNIFAQAILTNFLFMPLTHEEGHRSILTEHGIGAISQPYFNSDGAAYVMGVKDETLKNLRDTDLPTYIRLHTGGLESDYSLLVREETLLALEKEQFKNIYMEYYVRKFAQISYYAFSMIPELGVDLNEEADELQRDIVGHDVHGAVRHLHRPTMNFYRYTKYKDFTDEEKQFINRVGWRSLLNLVNMNLIGYRNIALTNDMKFNFGMGYSMCPFGDFIDENMWFKFSQNVNIFMYLRQYQNRSSWFNGGGISLIDFKVHKYLMTTISGHFWQQPKDLDFNQTEKQLGGAGDIVLKFLIPGVTNSKMKYFSIDIGMMYKSKGFLLEETTLDKGFKLRLGTTLFFTD